MIKKIDNLVWHLQPSRILDQIRYLLRRLRWRCTHPYPIEASWSADYWIAKTVEPILRDMSKHIAGYPSHFEYDDEGNFIEGNNEERMEEWKAIITKMADGFAASITKKDLYPFNKEAYDALDAIQKEGLLLFVEYFDNLWD